MKKKILVVDDSSAMRELLKEVLEKEGHEVCLAGGANEAIDVLTKDRGIDLVLTDRNMPPGMPGENLARWVKKYCPLSTKVVLMSCEELEPAVRRVAEAIKVDAILIGKTLAGLREVVGRVLPH